MICHKSSKKGQSSGWIKGVLSVMIDYFDDMKNLAMLNWEKGYAMAIDDLDGEIYERDILNLSLFAYIFISRAMQVRKFLWGPEKFGGYEL